MAVAVAVAVAAVGASAWRLGPHRAGPEPDRLDLLRSAWEHFNAGRYERSGALLDRRAAAGLSTPLDWMLRARMAEAQGQPQLALDALRRIPDDDPIAAQARLKAGQIERARHHLRAAEAAFLDALHLKADLAQAHRELAYIYALQRRSSECDARFHELSRLTPLDYKMVFAWGQSQCDIFDPDEAIAALIPAVQADPEDRWSRLALASSYRVTRRYDLAESTLDALPGDDPDARAIRARTSLDRGDLEAARALLDAGPADHPRLECLRGRLALQSGEPARAAEHFRAAMGRDSRDRDAIQGLGTALQRLHDPGGTELLRRASLLDRWKRLMIECRNSPRIDPKVFRQLGEVCESLGRTDQARAWFEVAIAWDPLDNQAHRELARLRRQGGEAAAGAAPDVSRDR